jgi:hypothetical protein
MYVNPQGPLLAFIFAVKELLDSCRSGAAEECDEECDGEEKSDRKPPLPATSAPCYGRSARISTTGLITGAAGSGGGGPSGGLPINVAFIFEGEGEFVSLHREPMHSLYTGTVTVGIRPRTEQMLVGWMPQLVTLASCCAACCQNKACVCLLDDMSMDGGGPCCYLHVICVMRLSSPVLGAQKPDMVLPNLA